MITAKLSFNNVSRYFEFQIDTGADFSLISKYHALILGLKLSNAEIVQMELADCSNINVWKSELKITIADSEFLIPIMITDAHVDPLMGRKGIFDKFDVTFKERDQKTIFSA